MLFFNGKYIHGYACVQLFCNDEWQHVPTCLKGNATSDAFNMMVCDVGIPELGIHTDNACKENGIDTEWKQAQRIFLIPQKFMELHSP